MSHSRHAFDFRPAGTAAAGTLAALAALAPVAAADIPMKAVRLQTGLARPVFAVAAPDDPNRLFIGEQHTGAIKVLNLANNTISGTYLTVPGLSTGGEQGLLGMAFDPNFATNGHFYVNITNTSGATVIRRYTAASPTATTVATNTASTVLTFAQPESNHNGGWIGFSPKDGYLYIASGDGGGGNDQHGSIGNGQNKDNLLGKMLRIDVRSDAFPADNNKNYAIPKGGPAGTPPKNPFAPSYATPGVNPAGADEIWHYGLRNPFRAGFDRKTGDLYIGDVGQSQREEIDFSADGVGGLNYGWRPREGFIATPNINDPPTGEVFTNPILDYGRNLGFSVTGGGVYRGPENPALEGVYFYADAGTGRIWRVRYSGAGVATPTLIHDPTGSALRIEATAGHLLKAITSFGEDAVGRMYVTMLTTGPLNNPGASDGQLYRLVPPVPGDANLDRLVNQVDLATFIDNYNRTATGKLWSQGDFNDDGRVDFKDFQILERAYGNNLPIAAADLPADLLADLASVPEPSAAVAVAVVGAGLLLRRRRA
jgi:glucose/arabinose dehydrogenase